jgi:putative ABC transport system ATP-binding protein
MRRRLDGAAPKSAGAGSAGTGAGKGAEVVLEGVRKSFEDGRVRALEDVSFRVEPGEFVALTGASGSGKSTLLNLVGALDHPDSGTIRVDGEPPRLRNATGFVFQAHLLIPTLSALENVQIPMFGRVARAERVERARALLNEVGLGDRPDARPPVLSGGERQRVAIARALANEPQLLLADEPTGALDWDTGVHVIELLQRLRETRGMTILLVTNDDQVAGQADRILHLRDGVIRAATPRSVPA